MALDLGLALVGSFAAGYLGAALGLVLGTLRLPMIAIATGDPIQAAGTNIAISAAAAASGSVRHLREGRIDRRIVLAMAPPSILGAVIGAVAAGSINESALFGVVAAALVWSGVDLAFRPIKGKERSRPLVGVAALSGLIVGIVGGAAGVILGTLRMPALIRLVGLDIRRAAGTNLLVGFLLGVAGFATHAARDGVDWPVLAAGLAGAIPGGWLGAKATGRVPERALRLALGATLVMVGIAFGVTAA